MVADGEARGLLLDRPGQREAAVGHNWHKRTIYWPSSASKLRGTILYTPHVTSVGSRAVTHFDWTVAIMAVGVVISVLAALYIGSSGL